MSSGVAVNPDVPTTFQRMAEGKKEFRYIIFKINDDKEVVVEAAKSDADLGTDEDHAGNSKTAFEAFLADVKEITGDFGDCRYAVFDFKFTGNRQGAGESKIDKIIFLQICPDGASIKKKMLYASSASAIKTALGTSKFDALQVSDESEMSHKDLLDKLKTKYSDK